MKLSDMTESEQHTLVTLVRRMVGADGVASREESTRIEQAASELEADDAFWTLVRENAGEPRATDEVLESRARDVGRREAQETIFGVLLSIATAGSIMGNEERLLSRLSSIWNIDMSVPPDRNNEV